MKKINNALILLTTVAALQGCVAAAVVGVAAGGVSVATDNRSLGNVIDDQKIEIAAHAKLADVAGISDNTNLQVISVNGKVLVVGQAPNSYLKELAIKTINKVEGVEYIHDQIRVSNVTSLATRSNDVWLTSKVKTALIKEETIDANNVKVVTENGEVFLMGLVNPKLANDAVEIARRVGGVNRVFKMFEIIEG